MPRGRSKQQGYGNRTDLTAKVGGEMTYGEKQKLMDGQAAVPMGTPATPEPMPVPEATSPKVTPVPLTAPTERPGENILTGASTTTQPDQDIQRLKALQPMFEAEAAQDDAPQIFREFVSWLKTQ
jgi:hypothetical protein